MSLTIQNKSLFYKMSKCHFRTFASANLNTTVDMNCWYTRTVEYNCWQLLIQQYLNSTVDSDTFINKLCYLIFTFKTDIFQFYMKQIPSNILMWIEQCLYFQISCRNKLSNILKEQSMIHLSYFYLSITNCYSIIHYDFINIKNIQTQWKMNGTFLRSFLNNVIL